MTEQAVDSLAALVARARAALAGSPPEVPDEPVRGSAAEGLVNAELTPEGRVRSIEMDPTMMRRSSQDICAAIATAVNDALDQHSAPAQTGPILEELRAVQEQSVHEMAKISQAFTDALARARRG